MAANLKSKNPAVDICVELARKLTEALVRERIVPRFVDSYVVEHGRYGLQLHAGLYRDLLTLIESEAVLAVSVLSLELVCEGTIAREAPRVASIKRKDAMASARNSSLRLPGSRAVHARIAAMSVKTASATLGRELGRLIGADLRSDSQKR